MRGRKELPYGPVDTEDVDDYTDDFIMREVRMQKDLIREQDDSLDLLGDSIGRMGEMALGIKTEIETQNKMIGDLEEDIDQAQTNIDLVTEKTKDLIKKSGGLKWFLLIAVLVLILLILVFLVIYS